LQTQAELKRKTKTLIYSLMSQFCPVQPGRHSQKYPPIRLWHDLAFTHGLSSHSLASLKIHFWISYNHGHVWGKKKNS